MENDSNKIDLDRYQLYQGQLQTYVSFTSFMTAVCVFFVGFLLSSFHSFDISIKVPVAFLIISLFSFLYSTLIYTSSAAEVSLQNHRKFLKSIFLGDAISEYWGVYLLVASIPLTVNAITTDGFLRIVTLIAAVAGLAIYQLSGISMIEVHFPTSSKIMAMLAILMIGLLSLGQVTNFHFTLFATLFLLFMLVLGWVAIKTGFRESSKNAN